MFSTQTALYNPEYFLFRKLTNQQACQPFPQHLSRSTKMAAARQVKRLLKELNLDKKISLIEASERKPKSTQQQLGEEFGIGRSTVSDILRKKAAYKARWEENQSSKR